MGFAVKSLFVYGPSFWDRSLTDRKIHGLFGVSNVTYGSVAVITSSSQSPEGDGDLQPMRTPASHGRV